MNPPDVIIVLPGFRLPGNYAWRVGLVAAIRRHFRSCEWSARYEPPRFIGYFFNHAQPVAICREARINLHLAPPVRFLGDQVDAATRGEFRIVPAPGELEPLYLLIHDRWDGACWLRRFETGRRFLISKGPTLDEYREEGT